MRGNHSLKTWAWYTSVRLDIVYLNPTSHVRVLFNNQTLTNIKDTSFFFVVKNLFIPDHKFRNGVDTWTCGLHWEIISSIFKMVLPGRIFIFWNERQPALELITWRKLNIINRAMQEFLFKLARIQNSLIELSSFQRNVTIHDLILNDFCFYNRKFQAHTKSMTILFFV